MKIRYNEVFSQLLTKYHLPQNLMFSIDLSSDVHNILDDQIIISELGVTLKSFNRLYKASLEWENQSIIEDNENHFHVDWYVEPPENKLAFMLGVKTLIMLSEKFQKESIKGIRFWYSFQTPELGSLWAKHNNFEEEGDVHFISDRLSFYKLREGEDVISIETNEDKYSALLTIDI